MMPLAVHNTAQGRRHRPAPGQSSCNDLALTQLDIRRSPGLRSNASSTGQGEIEAVRTSFHVGIDAFYTFSR